MMGARRSRVRDLAPFAALVAAILVVAPAAAQAPPRQTSAQPTLPQAGTSATKTPASPIVEQIVGSARPPLVVRKQAARHAPHRYHVARPIRVPRDLDRPALAGVELVAPLPLPDEPPHITVPLPAYPLDSVATAFTTPPPPIVCHRVRRDRDAPDPRLYREVPVVCESDNP